MSKQFWSPSGLKTLANLISYTEAALGVSQNKLGEKSGVNSNSLGKIKSNRINQGRAIFTPAPETVLTLADHLLDPQTGKPFEEETLLAIARGKLEYCVFISGGNEVSLRDFAAWVRRYISLWAEKTRIGHRPEAEIEQRFADACDLSVRRLRQIISSDPAAPTAAEIAKLSSLVPSPSGELYDVDGLAQLIRNPSSV